MTKRASVAFYTLHSRAAINHRTVLKCVSLMGRKSIVFQEAEKQMSHWGHALYYLVQKMRGF